MAISHLSHQFEGFETCLRALSAPVFLVGGIGFFEAGEDGKGCLIHPDGIEWARLCSPDWMGSVIVLHSGPPVVRMDGSP
jgi:hypothetical protein